MGFLRQVAVLASKHAQVGGVVPKEAQMSVLLPATITEVSVALCAGHVITALRSLNVDLMVWRRNHLAISNQFTMMHHPANYFFTF